MVARAFRAGFTPQVSPITKNLDNIACNHKNDPLPTGSGLVRDCFGRAPMRYLQDDLLVYLLPSNGCASEAPGRGQSRDYLEVNAREKGPSLTDHKVTAKIWFFVNTRQPFQNDGSEGAFDTVFGIFPLPFDRMVVHTVTRPAWGSPRQTIHTLCNWVASA